MKVIILCGGKGMRLHQETEYKPKPMVEIGGKPILWHIMKHYSYYGFNQFILALGYKGNVIREYFLNYHKYNRDFTVDMSNGDVKIHNRGLVSDWEVTLVETGEDSMTGYRTKLAGQYINEDDFMLTYGDAVSNLNLKELVDFYFQEGTIGTVSGVYPASRFGDLVTSGNKVEKFKQQLKDIENNEPINGGYFIFKKEFLEYLPDNPNVDLETDPLNSLIEKKELSVYKHKGFWQCMDTYRDTVYLNGLWGNNPNWKIWD